MYSFNVFAAMYFNRKPFDEENDQNNDNEIVPLNKLTNYSRGYLTRPLLRLKSSLTTKSLIINRLIVDISESEDVSDILSIKIVYSMLSLVSIGISSNDTDSELKDEIYSQLMRQSTNSPLLIAKRSMELMLLCLICFVPSDKMNPYFDSFLQSNGSNTVISSRHVISYNVTKKLAEKCALQKVCTKISGGRKYPPTIEEMECTLAQSFLTIQISLYDNVVLYKSIDTITTVKQLTESILNDINVNEYEEDIFVMFIRTYSDKNIPNIEIFPDNESVLSNICNESMTDISSFDKLNNHDDSYDLLTLSKDSIQKISIGNYASNNNLNNIEAINLPVYIRAINKRKSVKYVINKKIYFQIWVFPLCKNEGTFLETAHDEFGLSSSPKFKLSNSIDWPRDDRILRLLFYQILDVFIEDIIIFQGPDIILQYSSIACLVKYCNNTNNKLDIITPEFINANLEKFLSSSFIQTYSKSDGTLYSYDLWRKYLSNEIYKHCKTYEKYSTRDLTIQYLTYAQQLGGYGVVSFTLSDFVLNYSECMENNITCDLVQDDVDIVNRFDNINMNEPDIVFIGPSSTFISGILHKNRYAIEVGSSGLKILNYNEIEKFTTYKTTVNVINNKDAVANSQNMAPLTIQMYKLSPRRYDISEFLTFQSLNQTKSDLYTSNSNNINNFQNNQNIESYYQPVSKIELELLWKDLICWNYDDKSISLKYRNKLDDCTYKEISCTTTLGSEISKLLESYCSRITNTTENYM